MDFKISDQDQVFVGCETNDVPENYEKELMEMQKIKAAKENNKTANDETDQKFFTSDDGRKYVWDEEEECWVECDETEYLQAEAKMVGKRKATESGADSEDDDGSEHGDEEDVTATNNPGSQKPKRKRSKKKKKGPTTWIYVTGLPSDIAYQEIKDHFSKVFFTWEVSTDFPCVINVFNIK